MQSPLLQSRRLVSAGIFVLLLALGSLSACGRPTSATSRGVGSASRQTIGSDELARALERMGVSTTSAGPDELTRALERMGVRAR